MTPSNKFIELEKRRLVLRLKASRDNAKRVRGKCEGRKSYAESRPGMVELARALNGQRLSLRKISAELAANGHVTAKGVPFSASAVASMIGEMP